MKEIPASSELLTTKVSTDFNNTLSLELLQALFQVKLAHWWGVQSSLFLWTSSPPPPPPSRADLCETNAPNVGTGTSALFPWSDSLVLSVGWDGRPCLLVSHFPSWKFYPISEQGQGQLGPSIPSAPCLGHSFHSTSRDWVRDESPRSRGLWESSHRLGAELQVIFSLSLE